MARRRPWPKSVTEYMSVKHQLGVRADLLHLGFDPGVRPLEARLEWIRGRPAECCSKQPVIRIAPPDTQRSGNVTDRQSLACDFHDRGGELVNGNHLLGADVDGAGKGGVHEAPYTFHALVDV